MDSDFVLPIKRIGEDGWRENLQQYLESYDILCVGVAPEIIAACEKELCSALPEDMKQYYTFFGGIDSSDFMYGLKPVEELELLFAANFTFVSLHFKLYEINTMIFFSHSPGNDPLCFDKDSGEIYLFSHDPVKKAKVFADFNQYRLFALLETEKLLGDSLTEDLENQVKERYLSGEGIDYAFRDMKL